MVEYVIETRRNTSEEQAGGNLESLIANANKQLIKAGVPELPEPTSIMYMGTVKGNIEGVDSEMVLKSPEGWDKIYNSLKVSKGLSIVDFTIKSVYEITDAQRKAIYGQRTSPATRVPQKIPDSSQLFR